MERNDSIVTKGFLVKYNLMTSPFPRWFLILTLGLFGLIKDTQWIIKSVSFLSSIFSSESRHKDFDTIRYAIYNVVFLSRCVIATFALDWKAFAAYIEQLSRVELDKDEESVKRINRERRIKNCVFFLSLISYIMITTIRFLAGTRTEIHNLFTLLVDSSMHIGHFFLLNLIVDLCVCLKAAFQYINHHLAHFQISSPDPMLSELRRNRIMYSCTIRASKEAEKFARHYIAWFYFQFILFNIVNIVDLLGQKGETSIAFVLFMALDIINTAYLTLKLVAVNSVSTDGMEDLYEISFDLKSYNLQNENNLFLNRMLWRNVGFTFSNLFLINPNFITSLLSFSLTIALMIANFLRS
uniref:Gustatory receptor n=1 Tax=Tetranychus urticae TaxID=32264 RepID=T1KAD5_TETUR